MYPPRTGSIFHLWANHLPSYLLKEKYVNFPGGAWILWRKFLFTVCFWWLEHSRGYLRSEPTYFPCNVRLSRCSSTFWKWQLLSHCYLVATCLSHSLHCWENHLLEAFNRGARYRVATTLVKWSVRSQCYRLSFPMSTWNWISFLLGTHKPPASIRLGDRIFRNQWQLLTEEIQSTDVVFFFFWLAS